MKKVLILFLIVFILSSCGYSDFADDEYIHADPNKKAEIKFYVWDNASEYRVLAEQFKTIYPNWTVIVQENKANYFDNLKTYFGADIAPDMFYMESGEIAPFIMDGSLLNLSLYLDHGTDLTESNLWDANIGYKYNNENDRLGDPNGNYYAFAKDLSADFLMIYNKSHIDEYNAENTQTLSELIGYPTDDDVYPSDSVPMTWEQSLEMTKALAKFDDKGNLVRYGTVFDYLPWRHVMEWVQSQGASFFSEDGKTFNATDERVIAAFQHLTNYQFGENKSAVPLDINSVSSGYGFKSGSVSIVWSGRWAFKAYDWVNASFEIGIAPPPVRESSIGVYNTTNYVGISINKYSAHPEVAYKFLEFLLTSGVRQQIKNGRSFNVPGNYSIAASDVYLDVSDEKERRLNNYFFEMTKDAEPLKFSQYIDTTTMEGIFGLWYGKTWDSSSTPLSAEEALLKCKEAIEKQIQLNISRR